MPLMKNEDRRATNSKPAYLVASSIMPHNHGSLDAYGAAAHPLFEAAGAEVIGMGNVGRLMDPGLQNVEALEGDWPEDGSLTIFRFPSMAALQELWHSEAYQSIKHLRTEVISPNFTLAVSGFEGWGENRGDREQDEQ